MKVRRSTQGRSSRLIRAAVSNVREGRVSAQYRRRSGDTTETMLVRAYYTVLAFCIAVNTYIDSQQLFAVAHDLQGKLPNVPRPIVLPSLKSGLVLVALAAMAAFGFGQLRQVSADLPLDTEARTAEAEQLITSPIEQDILHRSQSMSALDSESVPGLSSRSMPPKKHPVHHRRVRSPRRGGPHTSMLLSQLHSAFRPQKQLLAPANARSATSGKPVAVFAVLRN